MYDILGLASQWWHSAVVTTITSVTIDKTIGMNAVTGLTKPLTE